MDDDLALEILDRELDAALGGVVAPMQLASTVLRRVEKPRILPEVMDGLAAIALLAVAITLLVNFGAAIPSLLIMFATAGGAFVIAVVVAVRALNEA